MNNVHCFLFLQIAPFSKIELKQSEYKDCGGLCYPMYMSYKLVIWRMIWDTTSLPKRRHHLSTDNKTKQQESVLHDYTSIHTSVNHSSIHTSVNH